MKYIHQHYVYILLSLSLVCFLTLTNCKRIQLQPETGIIQAGFCVDILGLDEPVFTKPFLESLQNLEKKHFIRLDVQTCTFARDYESVLQTMAQKNQLIFCGPLFSEIIVQAARKNPATFFVLLQSIPTLSSQENSNLPNLQVILFNKESQSGLMGQLCRFYPKKAHFWLVTDLSSDNPIRILQENTFFKGLQKSTSSWSVLEWPIQKETVREINSYGSLGEDQVFCLTEGMYLPSFLNWSDSLAKIQIALIMPDQAWKQNSSYPILGSVSKSYHAIVERIVKQVQKNAWNQGQHFSGSIEQSYFVTLSKERWESSVREKIKSILAPVFVQES